MITPRGDIHSPIWTILYSPSDTDKGSGTLVSGSEGYHFNKLFDELELPSPYITCVEDNSVITYDSSISKTESFLRWFYSIPNRPIIILLLGHEAAEIFTPETRNYKKPHDTKLDKWAGSLLVSPLLNYPHYCIPLWPVSQFFIDWSYRDIYKFIDLGKAKDELTYYTTNHTLNPLPVPRINSSPHYHEVLDWLDYCLTKKRIARDIETIRPPKNRVLAEAIATNYMYTTAIAVSRSEAMSFSLWNWETKQRARIWEKFNKLISIVPTIGQNFFQFDSHFEEAFGLMPALEKLSDTRIRHHILWPELPHSLQFMCKQYTRQKYYKDDGKTWSPKDLKKLLHYNALDTIVDFEVWERQEEEFNERPHLK